MVVQIFQHFLQIAEVVLKLVHAMRFSEENATEEVLVVSHMTVEELIPMVVHNVQEGFATLFKKVNVNEVTLAAFLMKLQNLVFKNRSG